MGNHYVSSAISSLIAALSAQSKNVKSTLKSLEPPFAALIGDVNDKTLAGKTWDGVASVSREIFQVTFKNLEAALEELDGEISKLKSAQSAVSFPDIDEDKATDSLKRITVFISQLEDSAQNATNPLIAADAQERLPEMYAQRTQLQKAISELSTFVAATSGLFEVSLTTIQNALHLLQRIQGGGFDSSGQYLDSKHEPMAIKSLSQTSTKIAELVDNYKAYPAFSSALDNALLTLWDSGWDQKGLEAYVKDVDTLVANSHTPGDVFSYDSFTSLVYNSQLLLINANQLDLSKAGKDYGNEYFLNGQPSYLFTTLAQYIPNLAPARAATQDEILKIVPPNQLGLEELPEAAEELLGLDETSDSTIMVDGVAADFATATGVTVDMEQLNAITTDSRLSELLSNTTLTKVTGRTYNFTSPVKGTEALTEKFDSLNLSNVRTYPEGATAGELPDGDTVNMHISSSTENGNPPSLEILNHETGMKIKIRY